MQRFRRCRQCQEENRSDTQLCAFCGSHDLFTVYKKGWGVACLDQGSALNSTAQILDAAFQLIRVAPLPLFAVATAFHLLGYLSGRMTVEPFGRAWTVVVLVSIVWHGLLQAMLALLLWDVYHARHPDLRAAATRTLRSSASVVGASLLSTVLILLGSLILLVPGIVLLVRYFAVPATVVLEPRGVRSGLRRSWQLAEGAGLRIFLSFAVLQIMLVVVEMGFHSLPGWGEPMSRLLPVLGLLSGSFISVLSAAVVIALYFDLRAQKEAYDLELLLPDLGDRVASAASKRNGLTRR